MDVVFSREDIHEMVSHWMARPPEPGALRIVTDTSDFFKEEFLFGSVSSKIVGHARNCTVWVVA